MSKKNKKNKNISEAEELRRKYEKKARKMAGMVAYGRKFDDDRLKAQTVLGIIFDYMAYIKDTRKTFAYPMTLDYYIEKRKNHEIKAPDDDAIASVTKYMEKHSLSIIDKIWAASGNEDDEQADCSDNDDYDDYESCEGCNDCGECASFDKCHKMNANPESDNKENRVPFATASSLDSAEDHKPDATDE